MCELLDARRGLAKAAAQEKHRSVSVSRGVILRRDDQTASLLRAFVNRFDDVNQFLLVLENPVEFVVVTGAEITHHVFVSEKEHNRNWVVEFVHLLEVGNLI
jgi:uncharacterized 2Fe-2S/4Fe-4S cluster protein (DUF4445 family)